MNFFNHYTVYVRVVNGNCYGVEMKPPTCGEILFSSFHPQNFHKRMYCMQRWKNISSGRSDVKNNVSMHASEDLTWPFRAKWNYTFPDSCTVRLLNIRRLTSRWILSINMGRSQMDSCMCCLPNCLNKGSLFWLLF